jgi:hypothetical protein
MRSHRSTRLLIGSLAAAAATVSLAPAVHARHPEASVPTKIAVPAGNRAFLTSRGVGVQIYSCNATPNGVDWGFVAPRADLLDRHGKVIISHFGGPTWQAKDGSAVVGTVEASVTVDPTAIPWLRLAASPAPGGRGDGRLGNTSFIQRVNTVGGLAPADDECTPTTVGTVVEVPYTADYVFWRPSHR